MQLQADSQDNTRRFCQKVASAELVHYIALNGSPVVCESNEFFDEDDEARPVMLFFSDAAYANRAIKLHFEGAEIKQIAHFDFLYRWLPGMTGDGVAAGPNWSAELAGEECEPYDLRLKIEEAMSAEQVAAHHTQFKRLTAGA